MGIRRGGRREERPVEGSSELRLAGSGSGALRVFQQRSQSTNINKQSWKEDQMPFTLECGLRVSQLGALHTVCTAFYI